LAQQLSLSCEPSALDDFGQPLHCLPAKLSLDSTNVGRESGRVASSPRLHVKFKLDPTHCSNFRENLEYTRASSGANVECVELAILALEIVEGGQVGIGEVVNVNIVANARPIWCVIVVAKDLGRIARSNCREGNRNQVGDCRVG